MGVGKTNQNRAQPSDLLHRAGYWGQEGLAGPALHLALCAVLVIRGPGAPAAQACDPIAHVQQHRLQGVGIHAPLVGLRCTLHIFHNSACEVFTLWSWVPQSHNRVDATGGQEAVAGMGLQAVDNGLIPLQHSDEVGGLLFPDEEGAVIRAADNVLSIAAKEIGLLDIRGGVAVPTVAELIVVAPFP